MMNPSRGEVWRVRFDPQVGAEIRKIRPALVVSVDAVGALPLRIVTPITEWRPKYQTAPWLVYLSPDEFNGLDKESAADCFQIKSVSLSRFQSRIGMVSTDVLAEVAAGIALCVGYR